MPGHSDNGPMTTSIDLIILAGGTGSRMGGIDKGLIPLAGKPAVQQLATRLLREGDQLIISANRRQDDYRALGATVVADQRPGQGPLAGLLAAISVCRHDWQLVIPCDMPWLPVAVRDKLLADASAHGVSVLHDGSRQQPLCLALDARQQRASLSAYLDSGRRSAHGWLAEVGAHPCPVEADSKLAFVNLNTPDDLPR